MPTESPKDRRKGRNGSCLMLFDLVAFGRADICRCYQVWPGRAVWLYESVLPTIQYVYVLIARNSLYVMVFICFKIP